jgi:hypothetical protein
MSGFINLLHNQQSAPPYRHGSDKSIKPIVQYYTPELFDGICDIRTATFSRKGESDKILELISVQVFRMPPFFEGAEQNNRKQVSKFNYREKTIYIP